MRTRVQIGADAREYFDGRSEKWQEGDKGQAYAGWMEPYEDEYLFPRSELECPEPVEVEAENPEDGLGTLDVEP
jgi:hypothetical protein